MSKHGRNTKEWLRIVSAEAKRFGATARLTGRNGHIEVRWRDGRKIMVTTTTGGWRAEKNALMRIKQTAQGRSQGQMARKNRERKER